MTVDKYSGSPPPVIDRLKIIFEPRGLYSLDETKIRYGGNTEEWAEMDRYPRDGVLGSVSTLKHAVGPVIERGL